ncbi:IS66 family transposase zinc-finger binding domain-containing protein [Rhizobium beringeri]
MRLVGEDVSEILDMIAAQMKVIEVARLKKSCRCCEKMVQVAAPSRPIPGSMAGAGLLLIFWSRSLTTICHCTG